MNVPTLASSISKSKYSQAVIRKVAVSHTKPLRSASRAPVVVILRLPHVKARRRDRVLPLPVRVATFRATSPVFCDRFSKLNDQSKGLQVVSATCQCLSECRQMAHMSVKMQIIACVTSYILWGAKTRWVLTMRGHLSSHISCVPRLIFEFEWPIAKSFSQLHDSACRNTVKWRVRMSNANNCVGDVVHTLGCQKGWVLPSHISGFP